MSNKEFGITVEEAVRELQFIVEDSKDFMFSEFEEDWAKAERYFAGESDLSTAEGRSTHVKTSVRDAIRAVKPNIMRTFLQAERIVEYMPTSLKDAPFAEQQQLFVEQLFWANGGYEMLQSTTDEAMKKKIGPVKTYWESDPVPKFYKATGVTQAALDELEEAENIDVEEVLPTGRVISGIDGNDIELFDVEYLKYKLNGCIRMDPFPAHEFFVDRNSSRLADSVVHGHARDVTVDEAIGLGLEYDDWYSLDTDDPEQNENVESSVARRGYQKESKDELKSDDLLQHKFFLTEVYVQYDLRGTGRAQKYCFWLGGTSYEYLDHEEIDDWTIDLVEVDPVPFTVMGRSLAELIFGNQDTDTSILRAVLDNAHMANNPRHVANPVLVDFADLMNDAIGAPIKAKTGGTVDTVDIPFTGQQLLPLLGYLDQDTQDKVGITKAATGLDPDALQSTDKMAVQNTIALAQGQTELMVRNIAHTGLMGVFQKLLKLSVLHMDRDQIVTYKGVVIPVDTHLLNPDMIAVPKVGLGTANHAQKLSTLNFVLGKQEQYMGEFGKDNPFVNLTMMYNTIEDIVRMGGLPNVGRYFKVVTPEIEQQLAKQEQEAAELAKAEGEQAQPMDPSAAFVTVESAKRRQEAIKLSTDAALQAKELALKALDIQEDNDFKRDKLLQDMAVATLKVEESGRAARAKDKLEREQARNNQIAQFRQFELQKNQTPNQESTPNEPAEPVPDNSSPAGNPASSKAIAAE